MINILCLCCRFTPNIECPDPSKAPPKPQVVTSMTSPETTPDPFFDDFYTDDMTSEGTTRPSVAPNNQSRSALAGRYPGRPCRLTLHLISSLFYSF